MMDEIFLFSIIQKFWFSESSFMRYFLQENALWPHAHLKLCNNGYLKITTPNVPIKGLSCGKLKQLDARLNRKAGRKEIWLRENQCLVSQDNFGLGSGIMEAADEKQEPGEIDVSTHEERVRAIVSGTMGIEAGKFTRFLMKTAVRLTVEQFLHRSAMSSSHLLAINNIYQSFLTNFGALLIYEGEG